MGTGWVLDVSIPPKNRITLIRPMSSICHVGERLFLWLAYISRIPCPCGCSALYRLAQPIISLGMIVNEMLGRCSHGKKVLSHRII